MKRSLALRLAILATLDAEAAMLDAISGPLHSVHLDVNYDAHGLPGRVSLRPEVVHKGQAVRALTPSSDPAGVAIRSNGRAQPQTYRQEPKP